MTDLSTEDTDASTADADASTAGEDATAPAEGAVSETHDSLATRLRKRLRETDPGKFGLLAVLALPGYLVESLAVLKLFMLFALLFFWWWIEPILDALLRWRAEEDDSVEPTDWLDMGGWKGLLAGYAMLPLSMLNPLLLAQDLFQMLGMASPYARYRGDLPADPTDRERRYRLPVEGSWTVVNGSTAREYSHSWFPATQRYAYDFVVTDDDGRTRPADTSTAVEHYYCYDEPVLAPADGVVVDAFDTDFEASRGGGISHLLKRDIRGNYVTIKHAPEEYSSLVHLSPGSVCVEPGDTVERGQQVGRCGHSGNSSEPHLHFQLQDSPVFETAAGLPPAFDGIEYEWPGGEGAVPPTVGSGDDQTNDTVVPASDPAATANDPAVPADDPTDDNASDDAEAGRTITAGQRVQQVQSVTDSATGPTTAPDRSVLALLERSALGVAAGTVFAALAGVVVSSTVAAAALAAASLVGLALWLGYRWRDCVRRPGGIGTPLGGAAVAVLWWLGLPGPLSVATLLAGGIVSYGIVATVDQRLHRGDEHSRAVGGADRLSE